VDRIRLPTFTAASSSQQAPSNVRYEMYLNANQYGICKAICSHFRPMLITSEFGLQWTANQVGRSYMTVIRPSRRHVDNLYQESVITSLFDKRHNNNPKVRV
jgi:hypothetical protein